MKTSAMTALFGGLAAVVLSATAAAAIAPAAAPARVRAAVPGQVVAANSCPAAGAGGYGTPLRTPTLAATSIRAGFPFLEGPVWIASTGRLLLSDMQPAAGAQGVQPASILSFNPADSSFSTLIANSGSNGLATSPSGRSVLAATQDRQAVSSYSLSDLSRKTAAGSYQGKKFNSPNDLTVRSDATIYFTDPDFQRGNRADQMGGVTGVYRVLNGKVSLVDATVKEPNGIALSPDEKTLYVGAGGENKIYKYPVLADGSVGVRTVFASIVSPDGVTVDCAGNIYWASYNEGKIHVFAPSGTQLGTISAGTNTTNAAFGGADRKTLYITSGVQGNFGLYRIALGVPGNPY